MSPTQKKQTVAYLGPKSSYSHQAALDCFDQALYTFEPQLSIQDVFVAVQSSSVDCGVAPFENSTNGSVVFTLDLFADRHNLYPQVIVTGEAYLDVHHHLIGFSSPSPPASLTTSTQPQPHPLSPPRPSTSQRATPTLRMPAPPPPRSQPSHSLSHLTRVYSHPQAFGQCELFLSAYLKGIDRQEVSSTSRAAELAARDPTRSTAAIASRVAADVHGLDVLAEGIEDREDNTTRFLILTRKTVDMLREVEGESSASDDVLTAPGRRERDEAASSPGSAPEQPSDPTPLSKSLISFTIDHRSPGALASALHVFATHDLNLTSINSRPSRIRPWHYIFFVEFAGSRLAKGEEGRRVNSALKELDGVVTGWRWLGSWKVELAR